MAAHPTFNGKGAGEDLADNPGEFLELDYLPTRIALVARLVRADATLEYALALP